ncbi:MAG: BatD family protein, partial [candidate division WOR-3 bacterium]
MRVPVVTLLFLLPLLLSAADIRFSAAVDRNEVAVGEQFTLTVTVEGSGLGSLPTPRLPQLDGFDNLGSTRSSSTNISLIGGRLTQSVSHDFIYFLAARREGTFTIGPCRITIDGTEYSTEPITITVTKAQARKQQPPARSQPRVFDPFGFFDFPEPPRRSSAGRPEDNIDLVASVDRTTVWQGEQLTVTYTLYTAEEIRSLSMTQSPAFSGFWAENVYEPSRLEYRTETYRGRRCYAATLKRALLSPTRSGELTIEAMTLSGTVLRGGGFFGFEEVPFQVSSSPIRITVRPLPDSGRPADFSGGVGEFRVSASLNRDTSVGGEPLNLTITITGTGSLALIAAPSPPNISGVKVLSPETRDDISHSGGRTSGSRSFVYPLIPQTDGRHSIAEQRISFFNPKTGQYYSATTPRLEFVATGTPAAGSLRHDPGIRVLGSDIAHIRYDPGRTRPGWVTGTFVWLFYPAGIATLAAGGIFGRHRRRLLADRSYARRLRSSRLVRKRLKEASRLAGKSPDFYSALNRAILGFVGDRYDLET